MVEHDFLEPRILCGLGRLGRNEILIRATVLALCAVLVTAIAAAPASAKRGGPSGSGLGVVVAHQDADTFVVANRGGHLRSVDASSLPAVGSVVKVKARKGVAKRIRVIGTATRAQIKGTVSASAADRFTVVGKPDATASVEIGFAAPVPQPALGQRVKVLVTIDGSSLVAQRVKTQGRGDCKTKGTRTLTFTPEGGTPITIAVPVSFDDGVFVVGATLKVKVLLLADGSYVLKDVSRKAGKHKSKQGGRGDDDRKGRGRGRDKR